ncbi:hypothetical protein DRF60_19940 [Chryseobacterium elymi]|uniref:Uncharacterized protein n=1 Tax=Chryseobacterium elymi TaxID=395936 RepID=A0A3D9D484_9FLAO|nr:hypothetical protein [Chryseobacterium elymi]REC72823.1 hypothetical protein DRF60_19940 [Chryseobacterium elymi]
MKKNLLLLAFCYSVFYLSQVGISTANPNLSADLELGSGNKALLLNRVPNTNAVPNPVSGMMIYDQSEECVKAYQDNRWTGCLGKGLLKSSGLKNVSLETLNSVSLLCTSATVSPPLISGKAYRGTLTVPYSNGDGSFYEKQNIQTNGITAFLPAGNFSKGNGELHYIVSGIPDKTGNVTFYLNVAGKSCSFISKN